MPWFPDFAGAAELVRQETRAAGRADPVKQYLTALTAGDTHALEDVWPGEVVIFDPKAGEVRGHRELRHFLRLSRDLLAVRYARTEPSARTVDGGRAVAEFEARIDGGVAWPIAVVAESPDERSVVFRSYFSRRPLDGHHHLRLAILKGAAIPLGDDAGRFQDALSAGDAKAAAGLFAPAGYLREPNGTVHRGPAALTAYFQRCFADGGIELEPCAVTDDGVRCAIEFNFIRWGKHDLPPQAGLAVLERGPNGKLAAARIYDDVEPPARKAA
ncbi:nuclear transport factor 2 family protein [Paractinoplanes durhamensis]|uniref:SnoaL-like domain-containing protein n=1 Tax=Paractinoplanes durhamensis TaxID=113563 RepID=A0ABQ3ZB12_9ACTN|nr:nuclear transport factor 2 family protein [Actinoplanes durhamensis]GIE06999.1 hypothetical protein Adu01nite_83490 [Actinoplanes durhamensis]